MNQNNILLIGIILAFVGVGIVLYQNRNDFFSQPVNQLQNQENSNNQAEEDFNNSGRAKAIEDETDLWMFYKDDSGFTIKYPQNVIWGDNQEGLSLKIESQKIETLEGTLGYDKETANKNLQSLSSGKYGEGVDFPFVDSKKIISIDGVNAQDFIVFSRFEVCSVLFERKAYFFNNGYQVVVTLSLPKEKVIQKYPQYFKNDKANCGNNLIWDFDKQKEFYNKAKQGELGIVSEWLTTFDRIVETIDINPKTQQEEINSNLLLGKWVSTDDSNSIVEFTKDKKIEYYQGNKVAESTYAINGENISVNDIDGKMEYKILELTGDKLSISYLARGNTLSYKKAE
ncbi:hypothetical protein M0R01_04720 [bacterium]|nr:hypothetical protein [bacterium]